MLDSVDCQLINHCCIFRDSGSGAVVGPRVELVKDPRHFVFTFTTFRNWVIHVVSMFASILLLSAPRLTILNGSISHSQLLFFRFYPRGISSVRCFRLILCYFIRKRAAMSEPSVTSVILAGSRFALRRVYFVMASSIFEEARVQTQTLDVALSHASRIKMFRFVCVRSANLHFRFYFISCARLEIKDPSLIRSMYLLHCYCPHMRIAEAISVSAMRLIKAMVPLHFSFLPRLQIFLLV